MTRRSDLNVLAGAVFLSALGDFMALVPLSLYLQEQTGSGLVVAALFVAVWSPAIVLAGPAGLLVDRVDARRVLLLVSLAQVPVALVLAFTGGTAAILVLAALLGCGWATASPAEFALVPRIVDDGRLGVANGRMETARYLGFTLGPFVGGALAAAGGMRLALVVNAVSFVAVAAAAAWVRPRPHELVVEVEHKQRARDGLVYLLRDRVLAVVMGVAFVSLLFMTASAPAEVFFAKDVLAIGDFGFGALIGGWTLGMALGATFVAPRIAVGALASAALVAIVVQGSGLAVPTLWLVPALAFVGYFVGGVAHGTKNVLVRTLIHHRVPARLHGRAFAAYNGLRNGAELFAIMGGGVLVAAIGARWTLLLAGGIPVVAALAGVALAGKRVVDAVPAQTPVA